MKSILTLALSLKNTPDARPFLSSRVAASAAALAVLSFATYAHGDETDAAKQAPAGMGLPADAAGNTGQTTGATAPTTTTQATTPADNRATRTEATAVAAPPGETKEVAKEGKPAKKRNVELGLSPGAPQTATLPGGVTPAFGTQSTKAEDWRFDFHGFVSLPLRIGVSDRSAPTAGQKKTVLHTPPRTPGDLETFEYTAVVPTPWMQLNFLYGNRDVTATVIVAARSAGNANGYFNPADQIGINDAFLTFRLPPSDSYAMSLDVGAFANRYGAMGEYDLGRYGTPLIGRVSGMGATGTGRFELGGNARLVAEAGIMGQGNKAPIGVEPAGWNGFADPNVGTSFAPHAHVGIELMQTATLGLHYISAFSRDDRATPTTQADGSLSVIGADFRLTAGRFGHFYAGVAHTNADNARAVSNVVRILNTGGGPGLSREYFGPESNGTGKLTTVGGQYDLSMGNLLRYPTRYEGDGPDVVLSAFGIFTHVQSPLAAWDGVNKFKYGLEGAYAFISWMALNARYDRVMSNMDDAKQTHAIITGRLILRSGYQSRDQVAIQYSRYLNGSGVSFVDGYPPKRDYSTVPDEQVLALTASAWW